MAGKPVWPIWLVFGLVLLPGLLALGLLGDAKDDAAERLVLLQDAVGHNLVLTGTLVEVETDPGLPSNTGLYAVTIPATGDRAGETLTVSGEQHWGFPPSPDHAAELDFLVLLDDPPHAVAHGPVGSVAAVTDQSVEAAAQGASTAHALWTAGIVAFWVLVLGLPALAVMLTVRRRRALRGNGGEARDGSAPMPPSAAPPLPRI